MTTPRKLFVAGATGETGKILVPLADARGIAVVPHVRPASVKKVPPHANMAVLELADAPALAAAMKGCTTVLQLIGTVRARFGAGDTYESSDIGTTRLLLAAAKEVGVDHFVLLSSVGAHRPVGAYLKAKAETERLVRESGLAWTTFRPSVLDGGGHKAPPGMRAVTSLLGLKRYAPITLDQLSSAMLKCAVDRAPLGVELEGAALFELAQAGA